MRSKREPGPAGKQMPALARSARVAKHRTQAIRDNNTLRRGEAVSPVIRPVVDLVDETVDNLAGSERALAKPVTSGSSKELRTALTKTSARASLEQRQDHSLVHHEGPERTTCAICREPGRAESFSRGMDPAGTPSWRAIAERALEMDIANGPTNLRVFTAFALLSGRGRDDRIEAIYRELVGADGVRADVNAVLAVAQARVAEIVGDHSDAKLEQDRTIDMVKRFSPLQDNVGRDEVRRAIDHHGKPVPKGRPPNDTAERAAYDDARRRARQHEASLAGLSGSGARPSSDKMLRSRANAKRPKRRKPASKRPRKI
jgi:hypothetical protein